MGEENKLLQFLEYLRDIEKKADEGLSSYYEKVFEREKAGMNSYGVAKPQERVLLGINASIQQLKSKIKECSSFEELEAKLKKEIVEAQDNAVLYELQRQLSLISDYSMAVGKTEEHIYLSSDVSDSKSSGLNKR